MTDAAPDLRTVSHVIENLVRTDRGRLLSALIARLRNFQLAEDALHDALASAVVHWGRAGLPASPQGWLLKVALRKAIDRLRKSAREDRKAVEIARLSAAEAAETTTEEIADERLRLIFTCCHPALEPKTRVALTLRTLGGLSTAEVAGAFLDNETTMGQRLSRARTKILAAGIPYAVPGPEAWPERLQSVLTVVYLIFNQAYSDTAGTRAPYLAEEAIYLARLLDSLRPDQAEIEGLLALMLVTEARRAARLDAEGTSVPIASQDRGLWDDARIAEGLALLDRAMARRTAGPFQIKAAIAALHVQSEPPDWPQIVLLYDSLLRLEPTPVVRLNRAVALAEAGALKAGLRAGGVDPRAFRLSAVSCGACRIAVPFGPGKRCTGCLRSRHRACNQPFGCCLSRVSTGSARPAGGRNILRKASRQGTIAKPIIGVGGRYGGALMAGLISAFACFLAGPFLTSR